MTHETSLSSLDLVDWNQLRSHWMMFGEYALVTKTDRKWTSSNRFINSPLFKTRKEAGEYVSNLIRAEARHRASQAT